MRLQPLSCARARGAARRLHNCNMSEQVLQHSCAAARLFYTPGNTALCGPARRTTGEVDQSGEAKCIVRGNGSWPRPLQLELLDCKWHYNLAEVLSCAHVHQSCVKRKSL